MRPLWSPPAVTIFVVFFTSIAAQAAPPVSDEFALDPGYRYWYATSAGPTALAVSETAVLEAWVENSEIRAIRRGWNGEEIDRRYPFFVGEGDRVDLSDADSYGWKLAYVDLQSYVDPYTRLVVANIDTTTVRATNTVEIDPIGGPTLWSPEIAKGAGFHVLAWTELGTGSFRLHLQRIAPDLTKIDPTPILVDDTVLSSKIRLAMTPSGGIIVYVDRSNRLVARLLGADGLPAAGPHVLGTGGAQLDVCAFGTGWLAAWTHPSIEVASLDANGSIEAPGIVAIPHQPNGGLSVAARDDVGLVAWRDAEQNSDVGTAYAVRFARGTGLLEVPVVLDQNSPHGQDSDDPRELAAISTGSSFAVLWSSEGPLQTSKGRSSSALPQLHDRVASARDNYPPDHPVLSQWIAPQGGVLYPQPLPATQTAPFGIQIGSRPGGGYLTVVEDGSGDTGEYIHVAPLGVDGSMAGPWTRDLVAEIDECGIPVCDQYSARGLSLRPWGEMQAVLFHHQWWHSSDTGGGLSSTLKVMRIANDGTIHWTRSDGPGGGGMLKSYDVALSPDRAIVFSTSQIGDWWGTDNERGLVHVWGVDGSGIGTYDIAATDQVHDITAVTLPGDSTKCLAVWKEGESGLRMGIFDTRAPGTLQGSWWALGYSGYGRPWLISSPDRILCGFPADSGNGNGYDIFGARFDANGAKIDDDPFRICGLPGNQGNVAGAWEGNHFLVTYGTVDSNAALYGNRVSPGRLVIDGDGFLIAPGYSGATVASAGDGYSLVGYGGYRIRRIDATATPVLLTDLEATVTDARVRLTWQAMGEAFEAFVVKRGDEERARVPARVNLDRYEWTDESVGAGEYQYLVTGVRRDGSEEPLGPIDVTVGEAPRALDLRVIAMLGAAAMRLRLEGPRAGFTSIRIYDVLGRVVRDLGAVALPAGSADLVWDGRTTSGTRAPAGVYCFEGRASSKTVRCKAVLIR